MSSEKSQKKKEPAQPERKAIVPARPKRRPPSMVESSKMPMVWRDFDRIFSDFRRDFEDLLWPSDRLFDRAYAMLPRMEEMPSIDLEDRGKDYLLIAEIPGFKKENIEIEVEDQAVDIRGTMDWKHDEKTKTYVQQERASESFHRRIDLPEEIKTDAVEAKANDGLLEIILPKKSPKPRKKVSIK
jgi:HSP20 family protein